MSEAEPEGRTPTHPAALDADAAGVSRRTLVKGAAWSAPVVALAVASAPAAAASPDPGDPVFIAVQHTDTGSPQVFRATVSNLPKTDAGSPESVGDGVLLDFCLPLDGGLKVTGVSAGWAFLATDPDFGGGDVYVYNTLPFEAGDSSLVDVTIVKSDLVPSAWGDLGATASVGAYFTDIQWSYIFVDNTAPKFTNCAAG
ncbi:hypothetical protein [Subtercola endophyticus]|uniref:hypothetical protein n=1 Tax=Subtercola endophyticus TaxID=2895559 RepID=UPI001E425310|nr:hypothetical protein [Subtercola endophyticus]UFS59023.1 hypothetical protein LQ955_18870 [Subtercola endophyticus]